VAAGRPSRHSVQ